jgi:hypothetical protein
VYDLIMLKGDSHVILDNWYKIYVLWCILMCNLVSYGANVSSFYYVVNQVYSIRYPYIYLEFVTNYSLFCVLVGPLGIQVLRLCLCSSCRWSSALIRTREMMFMCVCGWVGESFKGVYSNQYFYTSILFTVAHFEKIVLKLEIYI